MKIELQEAPAPQPPRLALFELGFRPFFALAGIAAVVQLLLWLTMLQFHWPASAGYYPTLGWHVHEMLFGYAVAVVAGFLLTAVRNWTGRPTPVRWPLAALALLWLAGRLLPWCDTLLPHWLIALTDLAFLPLLATVIAIPLLQDRKPHNLVFPPLLLLMAAANLLIHGERLADWPGSSLIGQRLMVDLLVLLLVIFGGRVIPLFSRNALPGMQPVHREWVERGALWSSWLFALLHPLPLPSALLATLAGSAALLHGMRLAGWHDRRIWRQPMLWVLHLGYGAISIGYLLSAVSLLGGLSSSAASHTLTVGAIGLLTLGMMSRVALGHSGRLIAAAPLTRVAFMLLASAALLRVIVAACGLDSRWLLLSGLLWSSAFAAFVVVYLPILLRPRIDGRPG